MKKNLRLIAIVFVVLFLNFQKSYAEEPEEMDIIVVTATRIAQHDYKIAGNVTVINKDEIEASSAQNIPDLLTESLGINIYNYGTSKSSNVDIRGFGETAQSNVLVLVNDRKINSVDLSGPDLLRIPIGSVERIEIIRGAGSVLYGDNAVGGVINVITKKGDGPLSGTIHSHYGSYDASGVNMEVSGSKNKFDYFVYANYSDTEGYRDNSNVLAKDFSARLGYNVFDRLDIDLNILWHEDKYGLPGALSDSSLATLGRKGSSALTNFATSEDLSFNLTLALDPWPEDMDFGNFTLDWLYRDRDVFDSFGIYGDTERSIKTNGICGKYIFDRTVFNKEVNFVTGIDYYDNENVLLGSNGSTVDATITKAEFGIYGFLQYEFVPLVFANAGLRYHKADYDFSDRQNAAGITQEPEELVSMGGMKYEYSQESNLHFNIQQTFRYLATDEWFSSRTGILNTDLSQQTGIQYEIGIKHNFLNGIVTSITPYWMDIKGEIYYDPRTYTNSNYDKTRRVGVEIGNDIDILKLLNKDFTDKMSLSLTYSYQSPEFRKGDNDGKDIPLAPRYQADICLITEFLENYNVSIAGRYVGSRFQISDIENVGQPLKPYYVVDTKLAYKRENVEVYTAINNLFNEKYTESAIFTELWGSFHYPSPRRNYTVGVKFKF